MNDLIKREDAVGAINGWLKLNHFPEFGDGILYLVPSADRPQGEWKAKSFHEVYCDNCGFTFDIMKCDFLENMKFCPNCGARMKGVDDD